jgi:hypothetical protein
VFSVCLREHGTHEILAIAGRRHGAGGVVGLDTRPDDRRVADPVYALVDDAAGRGGCGKVTEPVTGDCTDGAVFVCVTRAVVIEDDAPAQSGIAMRKGQTVFCRLPCFINLIYVPRRPLSRSRLSASICSAKNSRRDQKTLQNPIQRGQRAPATCGAISGKVWIEPLCALALPLAPFPAQPRSPTHTSPGHAVHAVGWLTCIATLSSLNGHKMTSAL